MARTATTAPTRADTGPIDIAAKEAVSGEAAAAPTRPSERLAPRIRPLITPSLAERFPRKVLHRILWWLERNLLQTSQNNTIMYLCVPICL